MLISEPLSPIERLTLKYEILWLRNNIVVTLKFMLSSVLRFDKNLWVWLCNVFDNVVNLCFICSRKNLTLTLLSVAFFQ